MVSINFRKLRGVHIGALMACARILDQKALSQ
jgi:hypothetical protein